jgi:tRNA G18 (ribose-2'-O)-methylase SpoU
MALGASGVILSPHSADPLYRKAVRVSMGGSLCVPFARMADWPRGLAKLGEAGYVVMALVPGTPSVDIAEFGVSRAAPERLALLLGTEGSGLSPGARAAADIAVRIAMAPGADSLNLATACGIALHRLGLRARREPQRSQRRRGKGGSRATRSAPSPPR